MTKATIRKRAITRAVVLCASMLVLPAALSSQALARDHVRLHKPHISHSELRPFNPRAFDPRAAASFSAYAGAYNPVPHNPLIPLRPEVPPPVDPNEPASGSYGASIAGFNAGGSTP